SIMWLHMGRYIDAREAAQQAYEAFIYEDSQSKSLVNVVIQPAMAYNALTKENAKSKAAFAQIISARASIHLGEVDRAGEDTAIAAVLHKQSPLPMVGYQLHALAGTIQARLDNPEAARTEFRRAIEDFEGVRANIGPDELRL